ncbi:MAG TPA: 3'(2'),5'-bisphosphate nucleotidase CysQ [Pyrinomonadaceae bacterium]|nr:3'(2'),5'-bisphosphate nucleotidase CysQ [Pyrinomonadaceae bacterium]
MLEKELETAIALARKAGITILEIYQTDFEVEEKTTKDNQTEPVTIADKIASQIIVEGLSQVFPDDGILSEEEHDHIELRLSKHRVWMIDPIDGTKGFVEKAGDFAVQIGLIENNEVVLGVVFQPTKNLLYFATKGKGAFMVENECEPIKMKVSHKTDFNEMTLAVSRSHRSSRMAQINEHFGFKAEFQHGSVGLKVAFLARQIADAYIHLSPRTKFWDSAAPEIILKEAGGTLTDIFGKKIDYTASDVQNYNGILATNGIAHDKIVEHLRSLLNKFGRLKVKAKN